MQWLILQSQLTDLMIIEAMMKAETEGEFVVIECVNPDDFSTGLDGLSQTAGGDGNFQFVACFDSGAGHQADACL